MPCCCAVNCANRSEEGQRLFRLPQGKRNAERIRLWVRNIGRENLPQYAYVCQDHFTNDQFEQNRQDGKKLLRWNAVPTLFKHCKEPKPKKTPKRRIRSVPPETVLKFPGVQWNPEGETDDGGENYDTDSPYAIQSRDDEKNHCPDILMKVSRSSVYEPEDFSTKENGEASMTLKFDADLPMESDPLCDGNDSPPSYDPLAMKTYPSKAILEKKQLLEKMKTELCRICAKKEEVLSPIFNEDELVVGDELTLARKLEMYLPIEINTLEDLPMSICMKCRELVLSWHELYVACSAADCVLREIFDVDKSVSGLEDEEQENQCEEEGEVKEEVRCVEEENARCKEERQEGVEETVFEELGTVYEEVETSDETKCEDIEMRSEKETNTGQDNLHNADDPLDDSISLSFKKQPTIKCYSTKRGIAEIREMSLSPEEEFENMDESCQKGSKRALDFVKICKKHWKGGEEHFTGSSSPQAPCYQAVGSQNVRKPLSGYRGDGKSIVRRKRNIREGLTNCTTILMRPLTCSHCNAIFTEWEEYNRHKRKCRLEPTICEECGAKISQRCYLKKHIKTHFLPPKGCQKKPPSLLKCQWCDKMFKSRFALRCHLDAFHNGVNGEREPTNYCEPCCKVFVSNISYRMHMKQHEDGTVKNCVNLELHAADGDSLELSYNCPVCGMSFPDKMQVISHMNTVNVKKCPKCRVRMTTERYTLTHKCKYWYCRFCNKQFYNKNRYQIHERVHTRERPYMCHICGKKFVSSESLFTHKKGHGKPVFKCEHCGKLFKKHVLYKMHMDSHAGKHYTCFHCDKHFIYHNNLTKHCKKAHRDVPNTV